MIELDIVSLGEKIVHYFEEKKDKAQKKETQKKLFTSLGMAIGGIALIKMTKSPKPISPFMALMEVCVEQLFDSNFKKDFLSKLHSDIQSAVTYLGMKSRPMYPKTFSYYHLGYAASILQSILMDFSPNLKNLGDQILAQPISVKGDFDSKDKEMFDDFVKAWNSVEKLDIPIVQSKLYELMLSLLD